MTFTPINPSETAFKAPIDETLMEKIRENFDDHESRIGSGGSGGGGSIAFKVNGGLATLKALVDDDPEAGRILDGAFVSAGQSFTRARLFLKINGDSGQTRIDIKRHRRVNHPITFMNHQLDRAIQSVGRVGSSLATQAITKRTPQISTQAINRAKSTLTVDSVFDLGSGKARYNIQGGSLLDSDYQVGKKIKFSSMNNGSNDGEFTILEVNPDLYPGIVVDNGSAVTDATPGGSADLQFFEYVFTNPADVQGFKVGELARFQSHSNSSNNGDLEIVRINDGGNNLIVYNNTAGANADGTPSGTCDSLRMVFTFAAAVLTTDYFVGEKMNASGHTSGNNNGNFKIVEINESGNNLIIINNNTLTVQAGSGGSVNTNRWTYSVNTDPSTDIAVGDNIEFYSMTSGNNDGTFELLELNRFALNNLTIYNESGVTQGSAAGNVRSDLVVIGFDTDQADFYEAGRSIATIKGVQIDGVDMSENNGFFDVVEINRGGGSATNIVCLIPNLINETNSPLGQVDLESRSLFDSDLPTIETGEDIIFSGATAVFNPASVESDSMVALDVLELPEGLPEDLSVDLS